MKVKAEDVLTRVAGIMEELRIAKNEVSVARAKTAVFKASVIANNAFLVGTSTQIRFLSWPLCLQSLTVEVKQINFYLRD